MRSYVLMIHNTRKHKTRTRTHTNILPPTQNEHPPPIEHSRLYHASQSTNTPHHNTKHTQPHSNQAQHPASHTVSHTASIVNASIVNASIVNAHTHHTPHHTSTPTHPGNIDTSHRLTQHFSEKNSMLPAHAFLYFDDTQHTQTQDKNAE